MPPPDAFASYRHYYDHLKPVWDALEHKGQLYVGPNVIPGHSVTRNLGPGPPVIVAGYPDLKRSRHRSHIFIEHGAGESWDGVDPHYSGGYNRGSVVLFICPNEIVAERNREKYPVPSVVVGSPRVEWLRKIADSAKDVSGGKGDSRLRVVVSFHWDNRTWPNTTSALPYFEPRFSEWASLNIRGHAHPRIADRARKAFARAGIEFISDFADVVRWADVYACDNSSTMFEAAACGLDVVALDAPWFVPDDSFRFGKYADAFTHCDGDLVGVLQNYKRVSYDEMVTEIFGTYKDSAARAASAIEAVTNEHTRAESETPGAANSTPTDQPQIGGRD